MTSTLIGWIPPAPRPPSRWREVRVEVTADDIETGVRASCNECPLARAILRALRRAGLEIHDIAVFSNRVEAWARGALNLGTIPLGLEQRHFIVDFDHSGRIIGPPPVSPHAFTLPVPIDWWPKPSESRPC